MTTVRNQGNGRPLRLRYTLDGRDDFHIGYASARTRAAFPLLAPVMSRLSLDRWNLLLRRLRRSRSDTGTAPARCAFRRGTRRSSAGGGAVLSFPDWGGELHRLDRVHGYRWRGPVQQVADSSKQTHGRTVHQSGRLARTIRPGRYRFVAELSMNGVVGIRATSTRSVPSRTDNGGSSGITFANYRFYVVQGTATGGFHDDPYKVFVLDSSGQRDAASDFDLDSDNDSATGITFANDRFYVVNNGYRSDKAYAYHASGERDPASDFDLDPSNGAPSGITFANDRFYVVDGDYLGNDKVYAYHAPGQRDPASDFDLDSDNSRSQGITFANDRFYVVDSEKVYAYHAPGQRDPASDFIIPLYRPSGITFANDRFHIVAINSETVYVYDVSTRAGGEDTAQGCATGSTIQSGGECVLEYPQGTPDAGVKFGRFAVGVQFGSEKGCVYLGSGFVSCTTSSISEQGTITAPSGNKYPFDFAANKIEDSSSWRISKLSITLQ